MCVHRDRNGTQEPFLAVTSIIIQNGICEKCEELAKQKCESIALFEFYLAVDYLLNNFTNQPNTLNRSSFSFMKVSILAFSA